MAMSGQTMGTVKITRELLYSGVEALAVISQLATLIKNILAGSYNTGQVKNKSRFLGQKNLTKKVLSRLQQAMKILSDSEKQIRASNDQTTWLTASLLQFATDPIPVSRTSSAGTSVMPSNVAVSDTSESRQNAGTQIALDSHEYVGPSSLEKPGNGQSEPRWEDRRKPIAAVRNSKQHAVKPRPSGKKMKGYALSMSACTAESSDHSSPCKNSVGELNSSIFQDRLSADLSVAHETPEIAVINRGELSGRKSHLPMHQQKMADVWRRVLQGSRSKVVKQLLKSHGDLISLSFTEGYAVAYIEFKHPQQKLRAKRSISSIAQAFQAVLGYPVEVRITMASFSTKSERIKIDNAFSFELECSTPFRLLGTVKASVPEKIASAGCKTDEGHSQVLLQDPTAVAQQILEAENIQPELHVEQRRTSTADERSKMHLFHAKEVSSPSGEHLENAWVEEDNSTPALLKQDRVHFQRRLESRMKNNGFLCWNMQKSSERQGNQPRRWHRQKGFFRRLLPCGRVPSLLKKQA